MAKQARTSSQVKLVRVKSDVIKGYAHRIKRSEGYLVNKTYFRPARCHSLAAQQPAEPFVDIDFDDPQSEQVYGNFLEDIKMIKSNKNENIISTNSTSTLCLTLLYETTTLEDGIKSVNKISNISRGSTFLSDTLSYLFGDGDAKIKTKKILDSLNKQKKITDTDADMILSNKIYGDLTKSAPKRRGRPPKITIEEKVELPVPIARKRGRPPKQPKGPFNVYDPFGSTSINDVSTNVASTVNSESGDTSVIPSALKIDSLQKVDIGRKKTKKAKTFSAFAETYKPLNVYLSEGYDSNVNKFTPSSPHLLETENISIPKSVKQDIPKEQIAANILKQQLQSAIIERIRFQNSGSKSGRNLKTEIVELQKTMLLNLIENPNFKNLNLSINGQDSLKYGDSQRSSNIQFNNIETVKSFTKKSSKTPIESETSFSNSSKSLEAPDAVITRLFGSNINTSNDSALSDPNSLAEKLEDKFDVRDEADYLIASALNEVAASVISKKGAYVKYKHLLEFVAITLKQDKSNSMEVLDNLSAEIVPGEFSAMDQKQKQKFLFGIKHLSSSLMDYNETSNLDEAISAKDSESLTMDELHNASMQTVKHAVDAANISYSQSISTNDSGVNSESSVASTNLSNNTIGPDSNFHPNMLKRLALKDFNAKTSEELRMEARLEKLKEEATKVGIELTPQKIAKLLQQVVEEQESQFQIETGNTKLKKGRKIRKNYVLPPEPNRYSLYFAQEQKKYLAAKDYLLNPGSTSLREVCQKHRISVPTLITYMDAGRVARMLVTGKYSGSTVIRDSSFNNRGNSSFPDQIKSLYLQKTYEKILEAKKKTLQSTGTTDDDLVFKLTFAKQNMNSQPQSVGSISNSETTERTSAANEKEPATVVDELESSAVKDDTKKLSASTQLLAMYSQDGLAEHILNAITPKEIATVILEFVSKLLSNSPKEKTELKSKIHLDDITNECVKGMKNSVQGLVDSNFDFDMFLDGSFKKKRGRGALKKNDENALEVGSSLDSEKKGASCIDKDLSENSIH